MTRSALPRIGLTCLYLTSSICRTLYTRYGKIYKVKDAATTFKAKFPRMLSVDLVIFGTA